MVLWKILADGIKTENLRDIKVQEELIDEFLSDYQTDTTTLERVFELNSKYNKIIEEREEISRNVNWKLKSFKWDNLFNYGEDNSINFENLNGIMWGFLERTSVVNLASLMRPYIRCSTPPQRTSAKTSTLLINIKNLARVF